MSTPISCAIMYTGLPRNTNLGDFNSARWSTICPTLGQKIDTEDSGTDTDSIVYNTFVSGGLTQEALRQKIIDTLIVYQSQTYNSKTYFRDMDNSWTMTSEEYIRKGVLNAPNEFNQVVKISLPLWCNSNPSNV